MSSRTNISGNSTVMSVSRERGGRFVKPKLKARKSMDIELHCAEDGYDSDEDDHSYSYSNDNNNNSNR